MLDILKGNVQLVYFCGVPSNDLIDAGVKHIFPINPFQTRTCEIWLSKYRSEASVHHNALINGAVSILYQEKCD